MDHRLKPRQAHQGNWAYHLYSRRYITILTYPKMKFTAFPDLRCLWNGSRLLSQQVHHFGAVNIMRSSRMPFHQVTRSHSLREENNLMSEKWGGIVSNMQFLTACLVEDNVTKGVRRRAGSGHSQVKRDTRWLSVEKGCWNPSRSCQAIHFEAAHVWIYPIPQLYLHPLV